MPRGWIPKDDENPPAAAVIERERLQIRRPKPVRQWYQFVLRLTATDRDQAWLLALAVRDLGRSVAPDLEGYGDLIETPLEDRLAHG